jgi:hypothetical protein
MTKIYQNDLFSFFNSLSKAQVACLAAELEGNPNHVASRMKDFTSKWTPEEKEAAAKQAINLFSHQIQ